MSQTLSTFNQPSINGIAARMIFAATAMENIYQEEIETGGRGVTQKFSSDTTGAQIRVVRPLPLPVDARELGAAINGGNFSAYAYQPESQEYGLNIITVIDDQVDIPDVSMDMIPVDIAKEYVRNISDKVVLNINAIKIAARFYTCFSAYQASASSAWVSTYTSGTDKLLDKVIYTNGRLNKGDATHGVSIFPVRDRIGLVSSDYYADFLTSSGVLNLGGANYGYDILKKGGVDSDAGTPLLLDNGYIGTIAGIPFHNVSDLVFSVACDYLGFPENTMEGVVVHISSAHGNLFGLATGNSINTIPCPNGQGVRLQPKYRMGAACILAKSVSWLVENTWRNPYGLKAIFTSGVTWSYKGVGSRNILSPTLTAGSTATAFTPSCVRKVKATDGKSYTDVAVTLVGGAWVVGDCDSISSFLTAYNAGGAVKGTLVNADFGTQKTFTGVTASQTVSLLVIDSDGTVALTTAVAHA